MVGLFLIRAARCLALLKDWLQFDIELALKLLFATSINRQRSLDQSLYHLSLVRVPRLKICVSK